MERRDASDTYPVLPDRAEPCVWMVAGVLTYRLCDRAYDCEHCPLDAAIHGGAQVQSPASGVTKAPEAPPAWDVREGLDYHPVYGWVAPAGEGSVRWGIDGPTARLLDRVTSVVLPADGTTILEGKVACWVMDDGELVPLRSPVTGTVARTNHALRRDASLLTQAPYDAGWLMEVEGGSAAPRSGFVSATERREGAARQMSRLQRAAMGYLHMGQEVGPTAQDGGVRLPDLRRMLGRSRYHRLVFSFLR
ncbi:MAG TPA: glycine cleavage system protein H [Acidobacteriota bacterium]|nr:glycine cleavage system protein H [Acidobacteriota bacterium]